MTSQLSGCASLRSSLFSCTALRSSLCLLAWTLLLVQGQPPPSPRPAAGIFLKSITLLKQFSWFEPSVYFYCQDGNITNLSFVKQVMRYYSAAGDEAWQPLIRLEPHTCSTCGVYERGWFHDPRVGEWSLCTGNFSALDSSQALTVHSAQMVTLNLYCPQCPVEDMQVTKEEVQPEHTPSRWFTILLACFVVAGVVALIMTVVAIIIYSRRDASPLVYEEQSKMLEMDRSESSASGLELAASERDSSTSKGLEHMGMEKRHTGSLLVDDRDDFV